MAENIKVYSPVTKTSPEKPMTNLDSKCTSENLASTSSSACEYSRTPNRLNKSFNITLTLLSPAASSNPFCRICHEDDTYEDLVSICKCSGSVGLFHVTCMERWLSIRRAGRDGHDKCEICNFSFETTCSTKPIAEWCQCNQGSLTNRQGVLRDIACFSMLAPLTAINTFLCIDGAREHVTWDNYLEAGFIISLATFLVTVSVIWNFLTIRYHFSNYYRWRSANQNVRLVGYFRKSESFRDHVNPQRNAARATEAQRNADSFTVLITDNQVTPSSPHQSLLESVVNDQTSNVCLAAT